MDNLKRKKGYAEEKAVSKSRSHFSKRSFRENSDAESLRTQSGNGREAKST